MAATEMLFGTALDFGLKREIAARMLQFPESLEQKTIPGICIKTSRLGATA